MTIHKFYDEDVEKVLWSFGTDNREIVLKKDNEGSLILSKTDVVALAKEFNLTVFEKDSAL